MTLDELNKASKRWMVNDDGIFKRKTGRKKGNNPSAGPVKDYTAGTSQKPSDNIVTQDQEKVNSIFDLVREAAQASIFDLVRNPLVKDSLTWSGHKLQGQKITPEQWSLLAGPNSQPYTTDGCIMGNPHDYTIATDEENVKSVFDLVRSKQN